MFFPKVTPLPFSPRPTPKKNFKIMEIGFKAQGKKYGYCIYEPLTSAAIANLIVKSLIRMVDKGAITEDQRREILELIHDWTSYD